MMREKEKQRNVNVIKALFLVMALYFLIMCSLYWLMGEQLHLRDSKSNIESVTATSGTIELASGTSVKQFFKTKIEIIDKISVVVGTYYRENQGTLFLDFVDITDSKVIGHQEFNCSEIGEGQTLEIFMPEGVESIPGHIYMIAMTADSASGSAISPLMNSTEKFNDYSLYFNDAPVDGVLCFAVSGRDHIWTGQNYWKLVIVGGCIMLIASCYIARKYLTNRKNLIITGFLALKKYKFLMDQMISRDFKTKYKRSILGMLWSFLNPLLMMIVQYFVFSTLFKGDIEYYHIYILSGIVLFNFFSEACNMTLMSIVGNVHLLMKVYIPKYIYPLVRVLSSTVNLLLSIIPLGIVIIFSGVPVVKSYILILFPIMCLVVFSLGVGLILATSMVFFRDTQFLWGVLSMVWMYATPIFYPISILPEQFEFVLKINPLYHYIDFVRTCIIQGVSPEPRTYLLCATSAAVSLIIGIIIFKKNQDKFVFFL